MWPRGDLAENEMNVFIFMWVGLNGSARNVVFCRRNFLAD